MLLVDDLAVLVEGPPLSVVTIAPLDFDTRSKEVGPEAGFVEAKVRLHVHHFSRMDKLAGVFEEEILIEHIFAPSRHKIALAIVAVDVEAVPRRIDSQLKRCIRHPVVIMLVEACATNRPQLIIGGPSQRVTVIKDDFRDSLPRHAVAESRRRRHSGHAVVQGRIPNGSVTAEYDLLVRLSEALVGAHLAVTFRSLRFHTIRDVNGTV